MSFTLITFGGLRLIRPDASVTEVPTHRAQALLLFLVLHRGSAVHRETICAALWPGSSEASARAQLRKALWRVRGAAGDDNHAAPLVCNEYQIGLDPARVDVDLWRFTDAMRGLELKDDATLNLGDAEVLLQALDINHDAFGRGVFDDWLLAEQEAQRDARILTMERLVAFHRVQGHLSQAVAWAQRALKLDPLREHLHASIIECLQAMGDRALALRQYRDCETVLRREIGVAPSVQVRRLFESLADDR